MVQGVSYILIRKIFYLWIHSLWYNCSYQRLEFLGNDCMTLLVYLCFILINYLILKQHIVLVNSMKFDNSQRSANLQIPKLFCLGESNIYHQLDCFKRFGKGCGVHLY